MGMTILFGLIAIFLLIVIIISYFSDDNTPLEETSILGEIVVVLLFVFCLFVTIWGPSTSTTIEDPKFVEEITASKLELLDKIDEDNITGDILHEIKEHNQNVNDENNLFFLWHKEDREEYLINYDYYYKLFKEQQKEKLNRKEN